jgi:hypothetical protein
MRTLVVADLHYSLPQYDWLVAQAPYFDLVILAGDHVDLSSPVDGPAQIVVLGKYLDLLRQATRVITCSGNHDLDSRDARGEKTSAWIEGLSGNGVPADGDSVMLDDTLITICKWWDGPLAQAELGEQLARDAERSKKHWHWVHHAPMHDSATSWSGSRSMGDMALKTWIEEFAPDMVYSGHIHHTPFVPNGSWVDRIGKTWVFNVGQHLGVPPPHIMIDSDRNEAVWMSMAGIQCVRLDQPLERPIHYINMPPEWVTSLEKVPYPNPDRSFEPVD